MVKYPHLYQYYNSIAPLEESTWRKIEKHLTPKTFRKNQLLYRTGDLADTVFVIEKGIVKTFYETDKGREYIKIFLVDNQIASPYLEAMYNLPTRATAQAVTTTKCFYLPFSALMEFLNLNDETKKIHLRVIQHFYMEKERREFELLTMSATERYNAFLENYGPFADRIPKNVIASYLGITPVSLSRITGSIAKE